MTRERFDIRDWWIAAALFAGNLLVLGPWLLTEFSNQPWNNGYIYVTIAKMFRDQKWSWNPLQYGGAPFHYLYPPLFHVLIDAVPIHSIARAVHLVTGIGYALAPVAIYVLGRQLFKGRWLPAFAAIFYSFFPSPIYLQPQWRALVAGWFHAPWTFVSTVIYEEFGHVFGFPLALLSIAAAWRDRWLIALLLAAAVMLTNWPALIGLGLILGALAVARRVPVKVIALAGTAYGLSAFWMTPGYFVSSSLLNRIVLRHTLIAAPFNRATWLILLTATVLIALSLWRRVPRQLALTLAWVAFTGAVVVSTLAGNYLLPSPQRYFLEFNAGLVLTIAALISILPQRSQAWIAAALMIATGPMAFSFLRHAWTLEPPHSDPRTGASYQAAQWLNQNAGSSRVFVAGELDSVLPLWSNVPQVGGSGQDISNFLIFAAERQIQYGCTADSARIAELWLRALNVRYLAVHNAESREYFHWFAQPGKFAALPVAWDNSAGDTIYAPPDFDSHEAVVVNLDELSRLPRLKSTQDAAFLDAYVRWSAGTRPADIHWTAADSATLNANIGPGEAILVKLNNAPGWHASKATTRSDPIGFLLIQPRGTDTQTIALKFGPSWDAWLGRAIAILTFLGLICMRSPRLWMAAIALIPAVTSYAILMARTPSTAAVAEDAFVRLRPPIINPGGIIDGTTNQPPPFQRGRPIAIYGQNFGTPADTVQVRVGDRPAEVIYHGPNLVSFRIPADAPAKAAVSVEVNGCQGTEFAVAVRE
ncbi:MAG TPA: IPT/TIG domain-containing protein [Bryobacteraceae bacterium]|nr:IPT/TIG domain-containing protein [Bryobacteraceae bacterium]